MTYLCGLKVETSARVVMPRKGLEAGGAAGGSGSSKQMDPLQKESEWLKSMAKLMGWMYEHFARYQMDEAQQGSETMPLPVVRFDRNN